ncbi:hypothetical protein HK098_002769 [Nowakowskiella sp. JEL0407]|nr:hypothetical protein HK098_002769 [Nowakowskiella sp. JEL0407]
MAKFIIIALCIFASIFMVNAASATDACDAAVLAMADAAVKCALDNATDPKKAAACGCGAAVGAQVNILKTTAACNTNAAYKDIPQTMADSCKAQGLTLSSGSSKIATSTSIMMAAGAVVVGAMLL